MKKFALLCVFTLFMCCAVSAAFGVEYGADFLETGNPGGWPESLKTFDDVWTVSPGRTVNMDIWINDLPEELITAGFQMEYDASLVSVSGQAVDVQILYPAPFTAPLALRPEEIWWVNGAQRRFGPVREVVVRFIVITGLRKFGFGTD